MKTRLPTVRSQGQPKFHMLELSSWKYQEMRWHQAKKGWWGIIGGNLCTKASLRMVFCVIISTSVLFQAYRPLYSWTQVLKNPDIFTCGLEVKPSPSNTSEAAPCEMGEGLHSPCGFLTLRNQLKPCSWEKGASVKWGYSCVICADHSRCPYAQCHRHPHSPLWSHSQCLHHPGLHKLSGHTEYDNAPRTSYRKPWEPDVFLKFRVMHILDDMNLCHVSPDTLSRWGGNT